MKGFKNQNSEPGVQDTTIKKNTFETGVRSLRGKGLLRKPVCSELSDGSGIFIQGKRYINFSSNDYLGLSRHPEIVRSVAGALKHYGFGSGASRLLSGTVRAHKNLEERIARFKKTKAALLFNTGYSANTGIIPALARTGTVIFSDELNHASIVDGIGLSKSPVKIYKHRDINHLESLLKRYSSGKSSTEIQRLVITDTVFSMNGDIAPLKDIVSLCKEFNSLLMIDDAHGTGVIGKTGRGGLEHFGLKAGAIIQMGTLSKAFGCFGGFVAGSRDLITYLTSSARSFMYSTSLPPSIAEAGLRAIDIVATHSDPLRKKLWKNRKRLHQGLETLGFDTLGSETPMIPVLIGSIQDTQKIAQLLFRKKIFAPAIRPPTVPEGTCRLRFSVTAAHTEEEIDYVLEILKRYGKGFKESRI
ncbi:MAG: 8-amino-7-oxononanoate synthase [Nitrospiraceae bacterium]|nr:MAG: 8-amino-7-oxononanoate synthase [Nitrospiraceae bacterium]